MRYINLLFLVLLISISLLYNYHEILFKQVQSIHKWRQADCASIALNYYQDGMDFFKPHTHNLTSDFGTSGASCTSEIPILYYTVALFYKIFGYHDFIYRFINTILFLFGLFYLFKLSNYLLKDKFWSIAISLLFFTAPVLVYYGNNYLSNTTSLSFSILGWYLFIRFYFESNDKWFFLSILAFLIASALKITALISLFAILGYYLLEFIGIVKSKGIKKLFQQHSYYWISFVLVFSIIFTWINYAKSYNENHDCYYFSTTIFPIWELSKDGIIEVLHKIIKLWLDQYFHPSALLIIILSSFFVAFEYKKADKFVIICILLLVLQSICYFLLQFWAFADHDYYTIDIYILPIWIILCAFSILKNKYPGFISSTLTKVMFSLFLIFNINYARQEINARYRIPVNDFIMNEDIYSITPFLRQIGITKNDTVISIPDLSHASLYLMNQKGWTEYTDARFNRGLSVRYNQDSNGIQLSINKGAKYLILNGIEELYSKKYLQPFCKHLLGRYNNVLIFDLRNKQDNFSLDQLDVDNTYRCNAEHLTEDKQYFTSETDSTLFQFGKSQSDQEAFGGHYSSKLDANIPYGMTIHFKNIQYGENFYVSIWRKTKNYSKGTLVASSHPNTFYTSDYKILKTNENGWQQIAMSFFIPKSLENQELTIYAYNPDSEPVFFDDLEIIRYKSIFAKIKNGK